MREHQPDEMERLKHRLADRIAYYQWLQWVADEQLAAAHRTAREAGMGAGIVHDLAVGVHPDGADTWVLGAALARGVTVGAPPDAFNQAGPELEPAAVAARHPGRSRPTRPTATCCAPCCGTRAACGSTT